MKKLNMKKVALVVALTLPVAAMAAGTVTGTTASAFDDLLTEVRGLLVGVDLQAKLIHCLHRILIRFTQPLWA